MQVVIVSDSARISGGAEKVALTSAIALAQHGVSTLAFTGTGPVDERLNAVPNLTVVNTGHKPFYESESKVASIKQVLWNQEAAAQFTAATKGLDPEDTVVHFHSYLRVLSASVLSAALRAGFNVVVTLHDYGLACPNMGFYHYRERAICHRTPLSADCIGTNCTLRGYVNKLGFVARGMVLEKRVRWRGRVKHFIAVSESSGDIMRPFLGDAAKLHLVLNPVDVPHGEPVAAASNRNLLFVGKLDAQKDPVRLAQAAQTVGMPVTFVGDGDLKDEVLAANPSATLTGWVTPAEVQQHQRSARALVMTSRWYEAAPLVIFDALAAGLPVVVPDTCCGREFIVHGETGFVYDSAKTTGLEDVLLQLKDDALVARMGKAAYDRFWQNPPTMARHVEGLLAVYEEAINA